MTNEQKTEAPERIDIWIQGLIRELRNEGYLVPYPIMSKAVQAHADQVVRDMAQPVTQEAAARLLKLCDDMDGLNTTMPDENGHKWRHSDLMDQTIVQMRTAIRALIDQPSALDEMLAEKDAEIELTIAVAKVMEENARLRCAIENYRRAQFDVKGEDQEARKRAARTALFAALEGK